MTSDPQVKFLLFLILIALLLLIGAVLIMGHFTDVNLDQICTALKAKGCSS